MLKNQIKTFLLLAALTALLLGIGQVIGGKSGLIIGIFFALTINFLSYLYGDRLILAMYKAKATSKEEYPQLHKDVEEICKSAAIPKPKIYLLPIQASNAFACGRSPAHSSIAVTEGILKQLSREELKGVLAHEASHVRNRDILIATVAATIAGVISYLAFMARFSAMFGGMGGGRRDEEGSNILGLLAVAILAPIAALLIQLAISRSREYIADERGARLLRDPLPLASALLKIDKAAKEKPLQGRGNESTAHLFIVNPFSSRGIVNLFSTHPPIENRVKRLRELKL